MIKPIAQLGREVMDARVDYENKHRIKVEAENHKNHLEGELIDRLRNEQPPDDLGEGYGKVKFTPMKTIRGKVFDIKAAKRYFEERDDLEGYFDTKPRSKAINDLVKECLETGQPIPDGIEWTEQPYVRVSRKKT